MSVGKVPGTGSASGPLTMAEAFDLIAARNLWGSKESKSGPGSTVAYTTDLRQRLAGYIQERGITSMLDVACGDFNWMRVLAQEMGEGFPDYLGLDIVADLITANMETNDRDLVLFEVADVLVHDLPTREAVLARDLLNHLPLADAKTALDKMRKVATRALLVTDFPATQRNVDCKPGQWRPLNLCLPPFMERTPDRRLKDNGLAYPDRSLAIWEVGA